MRADYGTCTCMSSFIFYELKVEFKDKHAMPHHVATDFKTCA